VTSTTSAEYGNSEEFEHREQNREPVDLDEHRIHSSSLVGYKSLTNLSISDSSNSNFLNLVSLKNWRMLFAGTSLPPFTVSRTT